MLNTRRSILVVEDDPPMARFAASVFRLSGYQTVVAATGAAALAALAISQPDAALVDLRLPDMPGWELIDRMREHSTCRTFPVLVWTGELDEAEASSPAVAKVLLKPVTANVLLAAMRDVAPLDG